MESPHLAFYDQSSESIRIITSETVKTIFSCSKGKIFSLPDELPPFEERLVLIADTDSNSIKILDLDTTELIPPRSVLTNKVYVTTQSAMYEYDLSKNSELPMISTT